MKRVVKRHMVLLEVMIALALIALCALPLLTPQTDMIRAERRFVDEIEADRTANIIFANIAQKMYQDTIQWDALFNEEEVPIEGELLEGAHLRKTWPYKMTYHFKNKKKKPANEPPLYALFELTITMNSKVEKLTFNYEIFVEKEQELATPSTETKKT